MLNVRKLDREEIAVIAFNRIFTEKMRVLRFRRNRKWNMFFNEVRVQHPVQIYQRVQTGVDWRARHFSRDELDPSHQELVDFERHRTMRTIPCTRSRLSYSSEHYINLWTRNEGFTRRSKARCQANVKNCER